MHNTHLIGLGASLPPHTPSTRVGLSAVSFFPHRTLSSSSTPTAKKKDAAPIPCAGYGSWLKHLVVMAMVVISLLQGTTGQAQQVQANDHELSLLTWNVYLRPRHLFWTDNQTERAKLIAEVIANSGFDVVFMQEAFDRGNVKMMGRHWLDSVYPYQILPSKRRAIKMTNGLWLLSKYPITQRDSIFFSQCAHADKVPDKGAIFARIDMNGKQFDIIGTHTQAQEEAQHKAIRVSQYKEMRELLIDKHVQQGIAQFVIGDLNTPLADSIEHPRMLKLLDATDGLVIVPESVKICTKDASSWGCSLNDLIPEGCKGETALLDYVLVRKNGSDPVTVERFLSVYRVQKKNKTLNLSDHYGIEVKIKL